MFFVYFEQYQLLTKVVTKIFYFKYFIFKYQTKQKKEPIITVFWQFQLWFCCHEKTEKKKNPIDLLQKSCYNDYRAVNLSP